MPRKIVYIVGGIWNGSGMERVLLLKANYMADIAGFQVHILLTENGQGPSFFPVSPNIRIDNLHIDFDVLATYPIHKKIIAYIRKQHAYKKRLRKYLLAIRPDITVSAVRREINFINSIPDGSLKIGEIHFSKSSYRQIHFRFLPAFVNRWLTSLWMNQFIINIKKLTRFVVLTHGDASNWTEIENVKVIPNPLPFYPEEVSGLTRHNVIAVGRYSPEKGFDLLIKAWKIVIEKHPDWTLNIYGNGEKGPYETLIHDLHLEKNCFARPAVSDIIREYCNSSIFALSSRYEGFGMVIAEAMACGVPPVAFDCPCGPADIIRDGEDGLLVQNGNIQDLAEKLCYLIENEDLRKAMGTAARQNIQRLNITQIGRQWLELFNEVLENQHEVHTI